MNSVTFPDLIEQGYSEVWVYSDTTSWLKLAGPSVPLRVVADKGALLVWGGHYGGVNGGMLGVLLTTTTMTGRYCRGDSGDIAARTTFYLYAR